MKKLLFIVIAILSFSCKSTKRTENDYLYTQTNSDNTNLLITQNEAVNNNITEIIEETIVESVVAVKDESGILVHTPLVTTTRKRKIIDKTFTKVDNIKQNKNSKETASKDEGTNFLRETEGQEVVGHITEGVIKSLFGNTVSYIATFFVIILGILITRKLLKNVNTKKSPRK